VHVLLRETLGRSARDSEKGALQVALHEAHQAHAVVLGIRPAALPKEMLAGLFPSPTRTFTTVSAVIGGKPTPPSQPFDNPKAEVFV